MTDEKKDEKVRTTADKIEEMWKAAKEDPSFSRLAANLPQDKTKTAKKD